MNLPFAPPLAPMLAKLSEDLPLGDGWLFEPKWDGFRALVFRDDAEWLLQSRDLKPLNRYFPELGGPILAQLPPRCVLDGEIVIAGPAGLDFDALLLRIHPAASRVALLARVEPPVHLTPATRDAAVAADWFKRFEGAGLDGVIAKRLDDAYHPDQRAMLKIKHERTCECVVAGFRWHKNGKGTMIGSLLLGLYDRERVLHHVGVTAAFTTQVRTSLVAELAPLREGALDGHPWREWAAAELGDGQRMPGATSRWNRGKDLSWEPLRVERVCEVAYDHMQGDRFRHAAKFRRWRADKRPEDCRYDQLEVTPPYELAQIFTR